MKKPINLSGKLKEISDNISNLSCFIKDIMNKNNILYGLIVVLSLTAILSVGPLQSQTLDKPDTVPYVNVTRYEGTWWEQAFIPYYWERGCHKTHAIYSLNKDGTIKVDNHCDKNGKDIHNVGKAVPEDASNSKLKVEFIQTLDIGGQYWIVKLGDDDDYGYTVISSPNYDYLWILSRQEKMDEDTYQMIVAWLKSQGNYRVDKL